MSAMKEFWSLSVQSGSFYNYKVLFSPKNLLCKIFWKIYWKNIYSENVLSTGKDWSSIYIIKYIEVYYSLCNDNLGYWMSCFFSWMKILITAIHCGKSDNDRPQALRQEDNLLFAVVSKAVMTLTQTTKWREKLIQIIWNNSTNTAAWF